MRKVLTSSDLDLMVDELTDYDVAQNGWEHEDKGLEFNLGHVLKELIIAQRKNFYDLNKVSDDLAPDAMHHALRLSRWVGFERYLVLPDKQIEGAAYREGETRRVPRRLGAYGLGVYLLGDYLHRLDHVTMRVEAQQSISNTIPLVSKALVLFALDSANEFNFRPQDAFSARLEELSSRLHSRSGSELPAET